MYTLKLYQTKKVKEYTHIGVYLLQGTEYLTGDHNFYRSDYFKALWKSHWADSADQTITVDNTSVKAFLNFLRCILIIITTVYYRRCIYWQCRRY
jgi:hypothetical protein